MGCQGEHVQIIPIPLNLIDFLFCYWYNYLVIWGRTQVVEEFRLENVLPIWKSCCLKPLISWDFSGAMNLIICLVLPISSLHLLKFWCCDKSLEMYPSGWRDWSRKPAGGSKSRAWVQIPPSPYVMKTSSCFSQLLAFLFYTVARPRPLSIASADVSLEL